jgi:hypothetical protein
MGGKFFKCEYIAIQARPIEGICGYKLMKSSCCLFFRDTVHN